MLAILPTFAFVVKNANTNRKKIGNEKIRTRPQSNPESQI